MKESANELTCSSRQADNTANYSRGDELLVT